MPYSVPPPEPPSITQTLPPQVSPAATSGPVLYDTQSVTAKTLFGDAARDAEPSLSSNTSAALLGSPISVGYPVEGVETTTVSQGSATDTLTTDEVPSQLVPLAAPEPPSSTPAVEPQPATSPIPAEEQTQPANQPAPVLVLPQLPTTPQPQSQPGGQTPPSTTPPVQSPTTPQPQSQPSGQTPPSTAPARRIVELTSDRLEYDQPRQTVTAEGNVLLRFDGGVLDADRLQVNLPNQIAVGEGNVALTRGSQVVRGQRFTYSIVQDTGELLSARGDIFIPTAGTDFYGTLPTDVSAAAVTARPQSDRITANQPLQQLTNTGGLGFTFGGARNVNNISPPQQGGAVKRVRFQAERIDFYPGGWQARNVRLTNDPFSPPELEIKADTATLTQETPLRSRIKTTRQRLVFDQGFSLPIPKDQAVIDRSERQPTPGGIAQIGYDNDDRGGLFVERRFTPVNTERLRVSLTPQFFAQQAVQESGGNVFNSSLYGLKARLDSTLGPQTTLRGSAVFTSLNLKDVDNNLRASLRLRQKVGERVPHTLAFEYSYRDRLYNGSLGFQTVQSSLGALFISPSIPVGRTGVNLSYQAGAQYVTARTDRQNLLDPPAVRDNDRTTLGRFQGSAAISRGFSLWQGTALPATATQGLRYTAAPVVPYLNLIAGVTGTSGFYSNGDNQTTLTGTVGLEGQFGHFSRSFLDYTAFRLIFSQSILSGQSPFLFDRAADTKVLTAGLTQQIYGPLRLGVQVSLNLDTGENYSTDYILEYSRRTYGIAVRYNPEQELGAISLRISDFNWTGGSNPFSDSEIKPVVNGVPRETD